MSLLFVVSGNGGGGGSVSVCVCVCVCVRACVRTYVRACVTILFRSNITLLSLYLLIGIAVNARLVPSNDFPLVKTPQEQI